jgi:6-phosphogluconolactonase
MFRAGRNMLALSLGIGAFLPMMFAAESPNNAGTVFVMTNAADKNEVVAYTRGSDGSFFESNRYSTEGRGSGGAGDPLQSQGSLTLSGDHSLLFAVNAGSGTVASFHVGPRGGLSLVDKAPTGGSEPLAVAELAGRVYVLNGGAAGTVTGFNVDSVGHLRAIKNASALLSATSAGGSSLGISPDGGFIAVTERLTNSIDTFRVFSDGTLGPIDTIPSPVPGVFSARFAPDAKLIVSATGPANAANASTISSFTVAQNGSIAAVSQAVPTFGNANCWNAVTPDGQYAYVSNAASGTVSGFKIGKNGVLTPIGNTVLATNPEGANNLDVTVSGDGKFLYTLNNGTGTVGVFAINADGTLTPGNDIQGLPANAGFNGIAAL